MLYQDLIKCFLFRNSNIIFLGSLYLYAIKIVSRILLSESFFNIIESFKFLQYTLCCRSWQTGIRIMEKVSSLEPALFQSWLMDSTSHTCLPMEIIQESLPKCPTSLITNQELRALMARHSPYPGIQQKFHDSPKPNFFKTAYSNPHTLGHFFFFLWHDELTHLFQLTWILKIFPFWKNVLTYW